MRTTAEEQPSGPEPAAAPARRRRGSAGAGLKAAPATVAAEPQPIAVSAVRLLRLDEGLYSLRVGELGGRPDEAAGIAVPAAQIAVPTAGGGGVEIIAAFPGRGPWLGRDGGTVILRSPSGGGTVMITAYSETGQAASELSLDLQRLDGPPRPGAAPAGAPGETALVPAGGRDVQTEVLLHLERAGDRLFPGRGWVGALGRRMRVEAFSVRPLERLAPADIELRAYMPNGGETPWIPGGVLCGTRGRGLPLTGFAVRVVPHQADRFEVRYQGSFFNGGISETRRDGEPCRSQTADDPLEAVNIRLIERAATAEGDHPGA